MLRYILLSFFAVAAFTGTASAQALKEFTVVIKDHRFIPDTITIPADEKVKLIVDNQDPTPEEFESHDLHREKIIQGNSKATIFVGPVDAGAYHFFGEFNEDSAQGTLVAE